MSETTPPAEQARAALRERMAEHLDAALAYLDGIPDPVERELTAQLLAEDLLPDAVKRVKAVRGAALQELRDQKLSLRKIGELIGKSTPRVDQIIKGK
ncbi:hypothetical protein QZH56_15415 [Streptomyces olivoreticuli]|uniref:hypothetical protein n=1 Tax=Streptomyces olivoreticuli TaxID=68246 RepID=UPI00265B640E|nr:hypothetical protein [Streptomyces olivoreticuli]WKK26855.1 hypothetical protein QZH56_15415 [Streptomyces olivoreticuli]